MEREHGDRDQQELGDADSDQNGQALRGTGGAAPRTAAHGTRAGEHPQPGRVLGRLAIGLAAGWALLAAAAGGVDFGDPSLGGRGGPTAAAAAFAVGGVAAALVAWATRAHPVWRQGPTLLAVGGMAALTLWTALSIGWAPEPDLAWIEADRAGIALAALVLGAGLATRLRRPAETFAVALAAGAALTVAWALVEEALPERLGGDLDPGRLAGPIDSANSLALLVAMALPGALWLASRARTPAAAAGVAAGLTALLAAGVLTLSRGGAVAMVAAVLVTLPALRERRGAALVVVAAGLGAIWPVAYDLSTSLLTNDNVAAAVRADAGLGFGWRLLAGMGVAAALAALARRGLGRWAAAGAATALTLALLLAVAGVAGAAEDAPAERDAIPNDPGRVTSLSSNNRLEWWQEAADGWRAAPIQGNGAGSFRQVHLRERDDGDDRFNTRDAHQIALGTLSDLGVVGLGLGLAGLGGVAWALVRLWRARRREYALPAAALVAFLAHAQLDVAWSVPALAAAALAACGVILAGAAPQEAGDEALDPRAEAPLAAVVAGLAVVAVAAALVPWLAAERVRASDAALRDGRLEAARAAADDGRAWNPLAIAALNQIATIEAARGDTGAAVAALRAAVERQPENSFAWRRLAVVLEATRDTEGARAAWRRVVELDPRNPAARGRAGSA